MSRAFRRATATLLVTIAATLAGAAPSHANLYRPQRGVEDPARVQPVRSFVLALLLDLFDFAGGAMDPNGKS
ncbi:MAG TPA: hypothetical protein VGG20_28130 [Thermoanaerobaculia bacterium]